MARLKNRGESGADAEEALSAWAEHSRGYLSSPNVSRQSSFNGIPSISRQSSYHSAGAVPRVAMDDDDDDPEVAPEGATMPLLSSMRSGPRICNELGFEALALAASQLAQREQEKEGLSCPEAPLVLSTDNGMSAELPQLGRLPSYSSLHLHTGTVLSGATDGEAAAVLYNDLGTQPTPPNGGGAEAGAGLKAEPLARLPAAVQTPADGSPHATVDLNTEQTSSSTASSQDGGDWSAAVAAAVQAA